MLLVRLSHESVVGADFSLAVAFSQAPRVFLWRCDIAQRIQLLNFLDSGQLSLRNVYLHLGGAEHLHVVTLVKQKFLAILVLYQNRVIRHLQN